MYYLTKEDYAKAKANGITHEMAYNRYYRLGYDVERAITEEPGSYKRITTNMQLWEDWKEVAENNGISKQNFYNRLNSKSKKKWTAEEAATIPVGVRKNTRISPEIYELARKNGIKKSTLRTRVFNQNWTPYRAATDTVNEIFNWREEDILCLMV
jgi:hypothetical protein